MANAVLELVDPINYLLDGALLHIEKEKKTFGRITHLDIRSAYSAVEEYKRRFIDRGVAFGELEPVLFQDTNDEIDYDVVQNMESMQIQIPQDFEEPHEIQEHDAAFKIVEIFYNQDDSIVYGRIQILNTPQGMVAQEKISRGMRCYISSLGLSDVIDKNRQVNHDYAMVFNYKIHELRGGWRLAFVGRGGEYGF